MPVLGGGPPHGLLEGVSQPLRAAESSCGEDQQPRSSGLVTSGDLSGDAALPLCFGRSAS